MNDGLLFKSGRRGAHKSLPTAEALDEPQVYRAENVFVTQVHWCKRLDRPFHEFLVFYVKERQRPGKNTARETVIVVDRRFNALSDSDSNRGPTQDERIELTSLEDEAPLPQALGKVTSYLSSQSVHSLDSLSSNGTEASDDMHFSRDGSDRFLHTPFWSSYDVCHRFIVDGEYFSVTQLAVLACTVHAYRYNYTLWRYHCYWYAELLYNTIKKVLDEKFPPKPGFRAWHDYPPILKPSLKVGSFRWPSGFTSTVIAPRPEVHEKVYGEFKTAWIEAKKAIAEKERIREEEEAQFQKQAEEARQAATIAEECAAKEKAERQAAEKRAATAEERMATAEEENRKLKAQIERLERQSVPALSTHQMSLLASEVSVA